MTARNGSLQAGCIRLDGQMVSSPDPPDTYLRDANGNLIPMGTPPRTYGPGVGTIDGTVTTPVGVPNKALIIEQDTGFAVDIVNVAVDGTYHVSRLGSGNYIVLPIDTTGAYRSKAIHTEVP